MDERGKRMTVWSMCQRMYVSGGETDVVCSPDGRERRGEVDEGSRNGGILVVESG